MSRYIECFKTELDLFSSENIQLSIIRNETVKYSPTTNLENSDLIEFNVPSSGDSYKDFSSATLLLNLQLVKENGELFKEDDKDQPVLINNYLNSIFKTVTVELNNAVVSESHNHAFKSHLENTLSFGTDATKSQLKLSGYYEDGGDEVVSGGYKNNKGYVERQSLFKNSKIVQAMGPLASDLCNQPKLILNNVDAKVTLALNKPSFFTVATAETPAYILKIKSAHLFVKNVYINPELLMATEKTLMQRAAVYPIKRNIVRNFTVPPNATSMIVDNISTGILPQTIIICLISNASFNGNRLLNPLYYRHFNMTSMSLFINGVIVNTPIEINYADDMYAEAYHTLISALGYYRSFDSHAIKLEDYKNGLSMLAFDTSIDGSPHCRSMITEGVLRIEARFADSLSEALTCLVYMSTDAEFQINGDRYVTTQY